MTQELSEIRVKIDVIDNNVHDLLMERALLVSSVAAAKRKDGLQIVQPAREAKMIRRLLKRHKGPLPQATIIRIWRELVGSVSLLQTGMNIAVVAKDGQCDYWDMAKDYFGSAVPMKKINGTGNIISSVREDEVSFGVMPWPEIESQSSWWIHLLDQSVDPISIICALPYASESKADIDLVPKALVISKLEFMPSDEDISFIGIKTNTSISRAKMNDTFIKAGFDPINIYSTHSAHDTLFYYIVEIDGFCEQKSKTLNQIKALFGDACLYCDVVGGYPFIPELKRPVIG